MSRTCKVNGVLCKMIPFLNQYIDYICSYYSAPALESPAPARTYEGMLHQNRFDYIEEKVITACPQVASVGPST
jgi:hypothetical protein